MISLTQNRKPIDATDRMKIIQDEKRNTLLIFEAGAEDAGMYECVASNPHGRASTHAKLLIQRMSQLFFYSYLCVCTIEK